MSNCKKCAKKIGFFDKDVLCLEDNCDGVFHSACVRECPHCGFRLCSKHFDVHVKSCEEEVDDDSDDDSEEDDDVEDVEDENMYTVNIDVDGTDSIQLESLSNKKKDSILDSLEKQYLDPNILLIKIDSSDDDDNIYVVVKSKIIGWSVLEE